MFWLSLDNIIYIKNIGSGILAISECIFIIKNERESKNNGKENTNESSIN